MVYHIDTGLIYDKFSEDTECPLCEIQAVAEEQFLYEFLNDAVMEDSTRKRVNENGFCAHHFDMLFKRQNKLSLALQVNTRLKKFILDGIYQTKNPKDAKKQVEFLEKANSTCIICDLLNESMEKYYKAVAQMFAHEKDFPSVLSSTKGFCLHHYAKLLKFSSSAGLLKQKDYLSVLTEVQTRNLERLNGELTVFCNSHDYRNAYKPLGSAATALPRAGVKYYGKNK